MSIAIISADMVAFFDDVVRNVAISINIKNPMIVGAPRDFAAPLIISSAIFIPSNIQIFEVSK